VGVLLLMILAACTDQRPSIAQHHPEHEVAAPSDRALRVPGPTGPIPVAEIDAMLKQFGVPGVSVAVISNFAIDWARGYGVADVESGAPVTAETLFPVGSVSKPVAAMASLKAVQDGRFSLDQDINTILKSWKLPGDGYTTEGPVTPRSLLSHTSGTGDAFGFPGYALNAPLPTVLQILDGLPPSNTRAVRLERSPLSGFEYSGGGVMIQQLALTDAVGRPFVEIARDWILDPIGMTNSTFEQPLPAAFAARAARAHDSTGAQMGDPWRVHPEHAAAGLWSTPTDLARFLVEVQQALAGRSTRVLSRALMLEMVSPVGVGPHALGFVTSKEGEGWYFYHSGHVWGFHSTVVAHRLMGYGYVIVTNGENGRDLMTAIASRIEDSYAFDLIDEPIPRTYGPVQ
jgi:CubicO group peptidase (beta-lactamase class C family)